MVLVAIYLTKKSHVGYKHTFCAKNCSGKPKGLAQGSWCRLDVSFTIPNTIQVVGSAKQQHWKTLVKPKYIPKQFDN